LCDCLLPSPAVLLAWHVLNPLCVSCAHQLAGQLRSMHKLPVSYVALDWHQMDKELGSEALVEAFWTQLSALLPPQVIPPQAAGRQGVE